MNRRKFFVLAGTTALVAPALEGCGAVSQVINAVEPTITLSASVLADAALIAKGLAAALGALTGLSIFTTISTDINNIENAVELLQMTMTQSSAQNDVGAIETAINDILSVAASASVILPQPFGLAIEAASVLIPIIEGAVGLVISTSSAAAKLRATYTMTPDDARNALHQIIGS